MKNDGKKCTPKGQAWYVNVWGSVHWKGVYRVGDRDWSFLIGQFKKPIRKFCTPRSLSPTLYTPFQCTLPHTFTYQACPFGVHCLSINIDILFFHHFSAKIIYCTKVQNYQTFGLLVASWPIPYMHTCTFGSTVIYIILQVLYMVKKKTS